MDTRSGGQVFNLATVMKETSAQNGVLHSGTQTCCLKVKKLFVDMIGFTSA